MDQIAEDSGLGLGTLYRHFPTKEALLNAIVSRRFEDLADLARAAEQIDDPGEAFETLLRRYLESAEGDAAFQLAVLGSGGGSPDGVTAQKGDGRSRPRRPHRRRLSPHRLRDHVHHVLQAGRRRRGLAPPPRPRARRHPRQAVTTPVSSCCERRERLSSYDGTTWSTRSREGPRLRRGPP
jgi:AcrR family transcriptional regulator